MRRIKNLRMFVFVASLAVGLLIALAFPFGPLFPWSPLKLGYNSISHARGEVIIAPGDYGEQAYAQLDQLMTEAENFHQLRFQRHLKVVACKDWATCDRGLPWMSTHGLGGVTLWGDVIYITPKLREKNFSTTEFLRHELSHAVIGQNTTAMNVFKLNEQPWFYEGIAVSFGRQHDYLKRDEFLDKVQTQELMPYLDPLRRANPWDARFAYPTQRYFIEWLKAAHGTIKFQQFLVRNIATPREWRSIFATVFAESFEAAVERYETALREKSWLPGE